MIPTIIVVDSSPAVRRMVEQISTPGGYRVLGFQDGPTALEAARKQSPALIIADFHLENITFSGFCKEISRQDSLAETLIVSIVEASDRLDESKLRALGVRAFLKKPVHNEQLLETINGILNGATGQQREGKPAKTRTWPPVSTATDDEHDESPWDATADDPSHLETEKEHTPMPPSPTQAASPSTPPNEPVPARSVGEGMLKGLFDHLLESVTLQADRKITDLLPMAIAKEVAGQVNNAVRSAVREEMAKQLAETFAPERLRANMLEIIQVEINRRTSTQLAGVETAVRQAVLDLAPPLVEQATDKRLSDLTDSGVKKHLPEALQAHRETIDRLLKKEVESVAGNYARQAADDMVREMANDPIRQAVQRIVPDMAETQIRAEIKRLGSPD